MTMHGEQSEQLSFINDSLELKVSENKNFTISSVFCFLKFQEVFFIELW